MVIRLSLKCYDMLANFSFIDNFALKKEIFITYNYLFINILEL